MHSIKRAKLLDQQYKNTEVKFHSWAWGGGQNKDEMIYSVVIGTYIPSCFLPCV